MLSHYQQDSEWQELMAGDIIITKLKLSILAILDLK
jgi:hypothetical protein